MRPLTKSPNLSVSSVTSVGSSTSSLSPRLSPRRGGLLQSPPPSPGLPSLIPRHGKKPTKSPKQQMKRLLLATCGLAALIYLGLSTLSGSTLEYTTSRQQQYELIEGDTLPEEPSALVVLDEKMRTKWTVSIPSNLNFPLQQSQYKDICSQAEDISNELQLMNSKKQKQKERRYYDNDPYFVEVDRAQRKGILPKDDEPWQDSRYDGLPSCAKSLTFVMETADAGMGNTLLSMWLAYGLAKKEGRAFFIDDTRWAYGNYTTYFKPLPPPTCAPAPPTQRIPCPHQAKHLIVTASTFHYAFGPKFQAAFLDPSKPSSHAQRAIFALMRAGFSALHGLASAGDATYAAARTNALRDATHRGGGTTVGLHVRRGDRRPWSYMYREDYIPLGAYTAGARGVLAARYGGAPSPLPAAADAPGLRLADLRDAADSDALPAAGAPPGLLASAVVLASDDPDVFGAPEVARAVRAQDRIVLAAKAALEAAVPKQSAWVDSVHGWEGGFFASTFWGLGLPESNIVNNEADLEVERAARAKVMEEGLSEGAWAVRQGVGRGYLLDLEVLGASDAVVCAVSSASCRVLAVMMGWERAIEKGEWVNVDGNYGWVGLVVDEES